MCEALIGEESVSVPQMQALHSCYHTASCDHGRRVWNKFYICMKKGEKKKKKDWNDCCKRSLPIHIHSSTSMASAANYCIRKGRENCEQKGASCCKLLQVQTCKHLSTWATVLERVALPCAKPGRPSITARYFHHKQGPPFFKR